MANQEHFPILVYTGEFNCEYGDASLEDARPYWSAKRKSQFSLTCPYCLIECHRETDGFEFSGGGSQEDRFSTCQMCGWWSFEAEQESLDGILSYFSSQAILKPLEATSRSIPIKPLATYIAKRPEAIRAIAPAKLEELVGAIYSEVFGYRLEFCSYARPDKGIDLIVLDSGSSNKIAIQVKRNKNPIELGQIHQFYGAMVDARLNRGVFVTTSRFRRGARLTAKSLAERSDIEIDLVEGKRLLEFLGIYNTKKKPLRAEEFPFWRTHGYWMNFPELRPVGPTRESLPKSEAKTWRERLRTRIEYWIERER